MIFWYYLKCSRHLFLPFLSSGKNVLRTSLFGFPYQRLGIWLSCVRESIDTCKWLIVICQFFTFFLRDKFFPLLASHQIRSAKLMLKEKKCCFMQKNCWCKTTFGFLGSQCGWMA